MAQFKLVHGNALGDHAGSELANAMDAEGDVALIVLDDNSGATWIVFEGIESGFKIKEVRSRLGFEFLHGACCFLAREKRELLEACEVYFDYAYGSIAFGIDYDYTA